MAFTFCEPPLKYNYSRLRRLSLTITLTLYVYSIFYTRVRFDGYKELTALVLSPYIYGHFRNNNVSVTVVHLLA